MNVLIQPVPLQRVHTGRVGGPVRFFDCLLRSIATSPMGASMRLSPLSARIIWSSVTARAPDRAMPQAHVPAKRTSPLPPAMPLPKTQTIRMEHKSAVCYPVLSDQDPHTNHVKLCPPWRTHRRDLAVHYRWTAYCFPQSASRRKSVLDSPQSAIRQATDSGRATRTHDAPDEQHNAIGVN